jgi:hypothetical protein
MSRMLGLATVSLLCLALFSVGCAMRFKKQEKAIEEQRTDCTTDQGKLRVLHHEKTHAAEQNAMGVTTIALAGGL